MTAAALYCRISEDREGDGLGVGRQEKDGRALAKRKGWSVVEVFVDNDLSGSKRSVKRPAYQAMLEAIAAGRVDAVVVWDLDRLTRQPYELEQFFRTCDEAGLSKLATVGGDVDLSTGDGLLVARIKGAVAADEITKLKRRVRRKLLEIAEQGRPSGGGRRPYGFQANRVDHEPAEVEAIRKGAAAILAGASLMSATPDGLDPASFKRLLCSPRMVGLRQHQGEVIGDAVWEPVLDRQDWQRLRSILSRRRAVLPYRRHLLAGIALCGECGFLLSAQWRKNPVRVIYQCRSARGGCGRVSVDGKHLEDCVTSEVGGWMKSLRFRRALQRHLDGDDDGEDALKAITEDEQRLTSLAAQVGELEITAVEWKAMRQPILDRIAANRSHLATLSRSTVKLDVHDLARLWDEADIADRRQMMTTMGVSVVVARAGKSARRFSADRVDVSAPWLAQR